MRTRTTWLSGVLVALGLGMFTTGLLAQTKTTVDVRNFEVLAVDGNNIVVRDERGTNIYVVPDDFRFKVNGKPMAAKELKPGMKGEATVTTKTTINPVTVTDVREATVVSTTTTSMLVRGSDGVQRRFTQSELDKRGIEMIKDGQCGPDKSTESRRSAQRDDHHARTSNVREASRREGRGSQDGACSGQGGSGGCPRRARSDARSPAATPAAPPTTVASTTPAPAAPSAAPMKTAPPEESSSWLLWVSIFIALAVIAFVFMRKKN